MGYAIRHFVVRESDGPYETPEVDPDEVLDWGFDWSRILRGDTISTSGWTLHGGQTTSPAASTSGAKTTVWPRGGDNSGWYGVSRLACTNRITTAGGRTYERTFWRRTRQVHPDE